MKKLNASTGVILFGVILTALGVWFENFVWAGLGVTLYVGALWFKLVFR
jgi:hypothetical protein